MQHQNPINKVWEEKHLNETATFKYDKKMHIYTLEILNKENEFNIYVDKKLVRTGSLFTHLKPSINPGLEIDDPSDVKPSDWVDDAKIDDPDAKKPDDWNDDEPKLIPDTTAVKPTNWHDDEPDEVPDPKATKPSDWEEESDGEWLPPSIPNPKCAQGNCGTWNPPMIKNPNYKGKWKPNKIDNPLYKGVWKPRKIKNENYFVDNHPSNIAPMTGLAIEVWTTNGGIFFDNFVITRNIQDAFAVADQTWKLKVAAAEISDQNSINENQEEEEEINNNFLIKFLTKYQINPWVVLAAILTVVLVIILVTPESIVERYRYTNRAHEYWY